MLPRLERKRQMTAILFCFLSCFYYQWYDVISLIICSLRPQLHPKKKLALQRHYLLGTCHLVLSGLTCMCFFLKKLSCLQISVIYKYNLSCFKLSREGFFKDAGEVVDVRFATDDTGKFKGFGHVEFATAEAAQNVSFCYLIPCIFIAGIY